MAIPLNDLEQYRGSMRRILTSLLPVTLALAVAAGSTGVAAAQQNPGPYTGQTGSNLTEQQQAQEQQNQQQQVQGVAGKTASSGNCTYVSLSLFNPQPGNPIPPGNIIITGQAQDVRATSGQGNGISNVQLFLRPRITGGTFLGYGTFGLPTTNNPNGIAPTGGMPTNQFSINASMPSTTLGPASLEAIATSAVDGQQYAVIVPFLLAFPALPLNTTSGSMPTTELPPLCAPGQQPPLRPFSGALGQL
jgi:hypothetical protein